MKAILHPAAPRVQRRPVTPLAIWIFEACAIVVLTLVIMVVNEFRSAPREGATVVES
jgi:hypothetical protein